MGRLDAALARFSSALDLLESRLDARAQAGGAVEDEGTRTEIAELKLERERLYARIAALEEESSSLAGLTEAMEMRLDGAIAEIRAALGRG